ncbi:hypothetical protein L1987_62424 [Smallanthus sonchifolius]|uniref:Uncharacterized protein n=1 Tax=Smallanthus sonchifolius TaxID=185202 RepID=A0ACB9CAB3_9ASTR|nr:hypothetical protein L1987_62424 [Smallanthus sonchifolius]
MASSLRLVTSNLITRSFRPTVVSASHFLSRITGHRSCTTIPIDADFFDQSWINNMCPKMSSLSFQMSMTDEDRSLFIDIPGGDGYVELKMSGVEKEDMKKKLPPIKEDMKLDGMLKVADLPHKDEFKTDIMANIMVNVIASFRDITTKRSWLYYDMFYDRSILGEEFCPVISSLSHISSFSINKLEDQGHESLSIKVSMPGDVKMKLTTQGLRVSLKMASLRLIASNLVTRSVLPTLASASRFLSINAGHRSHTSMPIDADFYDQSWPRILWFKISSISCHVETSANYRSLILDIPGSEDETDKGLRQGRDDERWNVKGNSSQPRRVQD